MVSGVGSLSPGFWNHAVGGLTGYLATLVRASPPDATTAPPSGGFTMSDVTTELGSPQSNERKRRNRMEMSAASRAISGLVASKSFAACSKWSAATSDWAMYSGLRNSSASAASSAATPRNHSAVASAGTESTSMMSSSSGSTTST